MSVIQKIRDKYATVMIIAVCVSLVAFLLMDAFVGPKSFFHRSTEVGEVDGKGIEYRDFANQMQITENNYRANMPNGSIDDATRQQIREQVWNKYISDILLGQEYEELGIGFSAAELKSLTVTPDADPQIQAIPAFQNPQSGRFDPNRVVEFLRQLNGMPAGSQERAQWMQLEDYLRTSSLQRKFFSMVRQAVYIPKWLQEEKKQERTAYADISYVGVPYTTISDSSIQVSDDELNRYLENHKALYQQEAGRRIEYVSFDAVPTAADTAEVMKQMQALKPQLDTAGAASVATFINRNSETKFYDGYIPENILQVPDKDSIISLPEGGVFGPYYDNGMVVYAKMVDKRQMPDSVKVRHILISTQQLPDSTAKARIDSIERAIRGGADFAAMVAAYSDDPGSKQNGGEYELGLMSSFVPEFKDYAFSHKPGDMGVVKTQYGYHLIEVMSRKGMGPAYRIAYLSKPMDPSQETENATYSDANKFAGNNRTRAAFDKTVQQEGLNKRVADNIRTSDYTIPGIGQARELIRWAYEDAEIGDVSNVFALGDHYVVAVLTGIQEEGLANLSDVRPQIEAAVRKEKKAAQIAAKMKDAGTLEEAAKATGQTVLQAQHMNFVTPFIPNAGFEPKVVGAAFNKDLGTTKISGPVYGNNGVYRLKVDSLTTETPAAGALAQDQQEEAALQQAVVSQLFTTLKKESDVKDYRLKFF